MYTYVNVVKDKFHSKIILSLEKLVNNNVQIITSKKLMYTHLQVFAQKLLLMEICHQRRLTALAEKADSKECHQTRNSSGTRKCIVGGHQTTHLTVKHRHFKTLC